jgi:indolepyruvate ferredoxin oxidoreductase alpha subunit
MSKEILLGDEAIALGAVQAGLTAAYSYPGTPASEIMEYLVRMNGRVGKYVAAWSVNEKTAFEEALGTSYAGGRTLVSFKHVGLNVAADPFMSAALLGINGGFVFVSADDPSMHSSQNEQDSRFYAQFALVPCFEPADHQEAYDMVREAYDLSEKFGVPIMMRMTTRISHSRAGVETRPVRDKNPLKSGSRECWTLLPHLARGRHKRLIGLQPELIKASEESPFNKIVLNPTDKLFGVIASGIAYNYVMENCPDPDSRPSILKIGTYPLPEGLIRCLLDHVETVLVAEEGAPFIEQAIKGMFGVAGKKIIGRLTGALPRAGELSPETVRPALCLKPLERRPLDKLANRPPQLCTGCPHTDTYKAIKAALKDYPAGTVFSDIGCYTLGYFPPHNAIDSCVCMGASVGMAKGASEAGLFPAIAVIGDSTFGHSGMTALRSAAAYDANMTLVILDNCTTAMTGGQPTFASGDRLLRIVEGLGVPKDHIRTIIPLPKFHEANVKVFQEEIAHKGISVIVAARECLEEAKRKNKAGGAQ